MYSISDNGMITLPRGDIFRVPLFINNGTQFRPVRYYIEEHPNAKVYLGIMKYNEPFEYATIRKKFTADSKLNSYGDLVIELLPEDTICLRPGKYYYEIKLLKDNGEVQTIVPLTDFNLL